MMTIYSLTHRLHRRHREQFSEQVDLAVVEDLGRHASTSHENREAIRCIHTCCIRAAHALLFWLLANMQNCSNSAMMMIVANRALRS